MFRIRIAVAIAVLLCFVLVLASVLYWGSQRAEYYLIRSHLANDAFEAYIQLSHDAYRHYKELLDVVVVDGYSSVQDTQSTYRDLQTSLQRLKAATAAEIRHVHNEDEEAIELEEMERVAELERLVIDSLQAFSQVLLLKDQGRTEAALEKLASVLEGTIDGQFKPLIDEAIADESEEVDLAEQRAANLLHRLMAIATWAAASSVLFALFAGLMLLRSLKAPIDTLVWGTRKVAKGDLGHRITIKGRNEFTYLAHNFNKMTDDLQRQQLRLLEAQSDLEHKVEVRTQEFHGANQKLQRIDRLRRGFFADISHELRTPLTVIRGEAEVTLRGRDRDAGEYKTALRRIVDLTGQLAELVEDLLFLARSESASLRFDLRPLLLNELIIDIYEDTRALAQEKRLTVALDLPEQALTVRGDTARLRQLLLILIDNACLYSKPGGGVAIAVTAGDGHASISIEDQGIGITAEELDTVFERFSRGKRARDTAPSGTGLGLPLAKAIVEAHHGHIALTSEPDVRTTVTVTLPVA